MKLARIVLVLLVLTKIDAHAQSTELNTCLSQRSPTCREVGVGGYILLDCGRDFEVFSGNIAWYPLRYEGPITVGVESKAILATRFPLYVEIVPLPSTGGNPCQNAIGEVVMIVNGGGDACGSWQESGTLDLAHGGLLSIGQSYALRIHFFGQPRRLHETPGVDCVRVSRSLTSPVNHSSWAMIKQVYR